MGRKEIGFGRQELLLGEGQAIDDVYTTWIDLTDIHEETGTMF